MAVKPGGNTVPLGCCFLPPVTVEHVVQHMTECREHVVIIFPDVHEHWFPRASRMNVPALVLSKAGSFGYPHHQNGVRNDVYVRPGVRAAGVGFRSGWRRLTARSGCGTSEQMTRGEGFTFIIPLGKVCRKFLPNGCSKGPINSLPRNLCDHCHRGVPTSGRNCAMVTGRGVRVLVLECSRMRGDGGTGIDAGTDGH